MKRLFILPTVLAAALLLAGSAAAAPRYHPAGTVRHPGAGPMHAQSLVTHAARAHFVPLGARLSGTATVSGTVYGADHDPAAGISVQAESSDGGGNWTSTWGTTDAGGAYSLTVAPGAQTWIYGYPGNGDPYLGRGGESWAAGQTYAGRDLYPGSIAVTANRGGPWGKFSQVWVYSWYDTRDCRGILYADDATTTPAQGLVEMLDGSYTEGQATFYWDEGVEFSGSWNVTSGAICPSGLTVNEADAQRLWLTTPYWYSGKPGATVKLALNNYPAGWINRVGAWSDDPAGTVDMTYGEYTSSGAATQTRSFKVAAAAKPGYAYWFTVDHLNDQGSLYLDECYQVCTIKASKTTIHKGAKIRLTGIVPTQGHRGSKAGLKKVVTVYAHKGSAPVPTKWDPRSKGWFKLGTVKTNGLGAYTTPHFKPPYTATLVVRYPGDDWYYRAYTSTTKIKVR
jgi:hypothetical protein